MTAPLWKRLKATASRIKPSMVSWCSGEVKRLANEVREIETTRTKRRDALCAASVELRKTLERKKLTHAEKDAAILRAAQILEAAY